MPVETPPSQEGWPTRSPAFKKVPGTTRLAALDVHIEHHPAGLFVAVAVQVLDDRSVRSARDRAIGDSHNPIIAEYAAHLVSGRRKIKRAPGGAITPGGMGTTGECP